MDSMKLSKHFWNMYNGKSSELIKFTIIDRSEKAMKELANKMTKKYKRSRLYK